MNKILKRSLALLLIFAFTLATVWALDRILLIKRYDGVKPMESFYAQEPGTVDVLLMGNSHMGVHVDTATLWREYGISAFALWGGVQMDQFLSTYAPDGAASLIWTHLDEAACYGGIVNVARATNLPVSGLSCGAELKKSMVPATEPLIWRLIFKRQLPGELAEGNTAVSPSGARA